MIMKVLQFPLSRITLFFIIGILFAHYERGVFYWCLPIVILCLLFLGVTFYFSNKFPTSNNKLYFGIVTLLFSFNIGITTQFIHSATYKKNHYTHQISRLDSEHEIELTLSENLKNTINNERFIANIYRLDHKPSCGKIILNIRKDSINNDPEIGSILKIKGFIYKNKAIKNPNQFDYGTYLENQEIYAQIYCEPNDIKTSSEIDKNIWYYTAKFRNKIVKNLEINHFNKNELSVVNALILGQQQDIPQDIVQDYQYAGAVHILSVSGLHVGFIMLFITFLLKPIPNTRMGSFSKLIVVILSLWIFGFIAGLAPSILRSVTMFSFVAIGRFLRRSVNIYHTLLVSILLILLFQPSFLFDVGFQLSYISLFFIVWLQPLLASVWEPKNKWVKKLFWDIITVSFAAQIGAFPLSIYYFHQFPGLFFLTNLIILPFMEIIMALGVVVMVMAFFDFVPYLPMKALEWSIYFMDKIINWVASFQEFIIQNIPMNSFILWTLYGFIIAIFIWLKKPTYSKLIISFVMLLAFQATCLGVKYLTQKEKELIVFNMQKNTLIACRNGKNTTVFSSDSILKSSSQNNLLTSYLVGNFSKIKSKKLVPNVLFFGGKKILILDSLAIYPNNIKPDYLIITQSPKLNLERFLQTCKPTTVIADGSNFKSYVKVWKATCEKEKIPFHATAEKGFYKLD